MLVPTLTLTDPTQPPPTTIQQTSKPASVIPQQIKCITTVFKCFAKTHPRVFKLRTRRDQSTEQICGVAIDLVGSRFVEFTLGVPFTTCLDVTFYYDVDADLYGKDPSNYEEVYASKIRLQSTAFNAAVVDLNNFIHDAMNKPIAWSNVDQAIGQLCNDVRVKIGNVENALNNSLKSALGVRQKEIVDKKDAEQARWQFLAFVSELGIDETPPPATRSLTHSGVKTRMYEV